MHTIELMEGAMDLAHNLGYGIRQEWMGGCGGGACEIAGKRWIFVDLSLPVSEQLDQLVEALRSDQAVYTCELPAPLANLLGLPRAA